MSPAMPIQRPAMTTATGRRTRHIAVATGVTVAVHLLSGRKLLWSVGIGTVCYVALLNWL